jgi:transglutaminase-like putative cysteine protease
MQITFAIPGFPTDSDSVEGRLVRQIVFSCAQKVGKVHREPGALTFDIDDAFVPSSSDLTNAKALEALMNCLTDLDSLWLRMHPNTPRLYSSGVFYKRTDIWDTIPALYARGFGDCKSLAACRVAELRARGIQCRPVFRFITEPSESPYDQTGYTMYHILVMFGDARIDGLWGDPSKVLGMIPPQESPGS